MTLFSYSFCMAMLHSLWQSGILLLCYLLGEKLFFRKQSPLAKRNLLYILLSTQVLLFIATFLSYFLENNITTIGISSWVANDLLYQLTPWFFNVYSMILGYKLIKCIYLWHRFKIQFQRGIQKADIGMKLFTQEKAFQFGIKRKVKIWLSTTVNTPVTFGFLKPVILLPVALLNNITPAQAEALIIHELVHIRMNDYLLNWFLVIAETIFFFNPFISVICKKIRIEREQYCDVSVIDFEYKPALYAEALLQAERIKKMIPGFQLAAVSRKKQLLQRIQFFSSNHEFKRKPGLGLAIPVIGLLIMMAVSGIVPGLRSGNVKAEISAVSVGFKDNSQADQSRTFVNSSPVIDDKTFNTISDKTEKQLPLFTKQIEKLQPSIEVVTDQANEISENIQEEFAAPAAIQENDATREVVIKEETSGTTTASVKIYTLSFKNDQWVLEPKIMVVAIPNVDSIIRKQTKRLLPPQ